jgi:pimeloyl-ACP methyl ester carboxylesterase
MSTAAVARDVIEIFERHGEWREQEASRLISSRSDLTAQEQDSVRERTAWRKGSELVQYWGFSYGSILGATLSTMYPERIYRTVLDGVADSHG